MGKLNKCKNVKRSGAYYTGKEPSPKGLGYCARGEKIGTKMTGKNKKMWKVKSVKYKNKRVRRWVPM